MKKSGLSETSIRAAAIRARTREQRKKRRRNSERRATSRCDEVGWREEERRVATTLREGCSSSELSIVKVMRHDVFTVAEMMYRGKK